MTDGERINRIHVALSARASLESSIQTTIAAKIAILQADAGYADLAAPTKTAVTAIATQIALLTDPATIVENV